MDNGKHIYLDNHATTKVDARVVDAMLPYFSEVYGNPHSNHSCGLMARAAVIKSRNDILRAFAAPLSKLIFTSCATESIAFVFQSVARSFDCSGHIVTQKTEHKAVLENCELLESMGWDVTYLDVNNSGTVSPTDVGDAIRPETSLICIMEVNNEIGSINPIAEISKIARENNVPLMVDAAQAIGKSPVHIDRHDIDFYVFSGHKIYGPKGIAGLLVNEGGLNLLHPQFPGGYQDSGIRSGTLNVPGIVGLAKAVELSITGLADELERIGNLRKNIIEELKRAEIDFTINGKLENSVPNNLNICFNNVQNHVLQNKLFHHLSLSAASACNGTKQSYVLRAIGLSGIQIKHSVRIGLGRFNTASEIKIAAKRIIGSIKEIID